MLVSDGRVACSACRLRFPDEPALQRHAELDHAPAPDGLDLLLRALSSPQQVGGPPAADPLTACRATGDPPGAPPGPPPDWPVLLGTALVLGWAVAILLMLLLGAPA